MTRASFPVFVLLVFAVSSVLFLNLKSKEEDKTEKAISPLNKTGFEMSLFVFCYLNSGRCFSK